MADPKGFAEGQAKYQAGPAKSQRWDLKIAANGRIVIPAAARAAMQLDEDGTVTATLHEDGELRIISYRAAIRRVQAFIKAHDKGTGSVVDELIAERRAAAERGD